MTTRKTSFPGRQSALGSLAILALASGLATSCGQADGEVSNLAAGDTAQTKAPRLTLGEGLLAAQLAGAEIEGGALETDLTCCDTEPTEGGILPTFDEFEESVSDMTIPDVTLIDQDGKPVRFYSDLVQGKLVAINFIFTTCTTICPPLTANFAELQRLESGRAREDFGLISISVDPLNDTPQRMQAWGQKFGAQPGWTFLTGDKHDIDNLLKSLGVFTPLKEDHSPLVLVGNEPAGRWTRAYGLASPAKLSQVIERLAAAPALEPQAVTQPEEAGQVEKTSQVEEVDSFVNESAHQYFTDVELINQDGETMRLYSDLIRGKVVIIDCFFTECTGVCPVLANNMVVIQEAMGDMLGDSVIMLSISVDSVTDTPEKLKEYAKRYEARPGWYFLSGEPSKVQEALQRLGFAVESRDQHSNLILIGNDRTGLWKKAFGLAKIDEILPIVESVVGDEGE